MGRSFEELIAEAEAADVTGWDFSWLDGRAFEERPPWGYQKLMGERIGQAELTLDIPDRWRGGAGRGPAAGRQGHGGH